MAGRKGRSGGQNKIDPQLHLMRGTFVAARHAKALAAQRMGGPTWTPSAEHLAALGDDGRALVGRLTDVYEFAPIEGELVLELAAVVDRLGEIRRTRDRLEGPLRLAADQLEQGWQRRWVALVSALRARL